MYQNNQFKKIALGMGGSIALFFGAIILPLCAFGELVEGASRLPGIVLGSVFTAASIFCFTKLIIITRRERRLNRYITIVGKQKRIPLKWLADKMNCGEEKAVKNLCYAICHGLFTDAHIDENNGFLLFPNYDTQGSSKTVICPNCGAGVEVMTGYYAKCTYCGHVLETSASVL